MSNFLRRLSELEIWVAVVAVAASVLLPALLLPALLVLLAFWPIRKVAHGQWTERTPADPGITILAVLALLLPFESALPLKSMPQALRLLVGIGFYYSLVNGICCERRLKAALGGVLLAALGLAAFAAISVDWTQTKLPCLPPSLYDRFLLLVSDTVHPNVLAGNLVILLAGLGALLLWGWNLLKPAWYALFVLLFTILLAILVLSQSRGALMAMGASLLLLAALRWRWGWLVGAIAVIATGILIGLADSPVLLDSLLGGTALGGFDGRLEIWTRAVYMIQDFPFTGVGIGLYGDAADLLYPFFRIGPGHVSHAHNLFLQIGVDMGIPGLVAWLSVYLLVFAAGWQLYRKGRADRSSWRAACGAGILALQAALTIHGLFDAVTWGMVRPAPLVWGLWGLAMAAWRQVEGRAGSA